MSNCVHIINIYKHCNKISNPTTYIAKCQNIFVNTTRPTLNSPNRNIIKIWYYWLTIVYKMLYSVYMVCVHLYLLSTIIHDEKVMVVSLQNLFIILCNNLSYQQKSNKSTILLMYHMALPLNTLTLPLQYNSLEIQNSRNKLIKRNKL